MWWWVGFCVVTGCVSTAVMLWMGRSRRKRPFVVRETGAVLAPITHPGGSSSWLLVGAGALAGDLGKIHGSWPLAVLEWGDGQLSLRIRPELLTRAVGVRPLRVSPGGGAVAFPASGYFGSQWVGIRAGEGEGYFRTTRRQELLGILQAAGFEVTWAELKITHL
jgi:hypothetical protein